MTIAIRRIAMVLVSACVIAWTAGIASAQSASQLVGTWTLVSNVNTAADGSKNYPFTEKAQGLLIFDAGGRYSLQICRPDRAKFASGVRDKGTAEEYQASVHGCNPHWGRYAVADGAITFMIEQAMFPNWTSLQQKRSFTVKGDELTYIVPAASSGGVSEIKWRRAP